MNTPTCAGFISLEGNGTKCEGEANPQLWFEDDGKRYYFCKASHLLRHLIEYYGKQGKSAKETNKEVVKNKKRKHASTKAVKASTKAVKDKEKSKEKKSKPTTTSGSENNASTL